MKLNPDKLRIAEVIFSVNAVKTYAYMTYDEDIKPGDYVVVDTRTGLSIAKVRSLREPLKENEPANRFIVQAISLWPLRQSMRYAEGNMNVLLPAPMTDIMEMISTETRVAKDILQTLRDAELLMPGDIPNAFAQIAEKYGLKGEIYG